jgi:hypothetical protein
MMADLKLTPGNDLDVTNGALSLVTGSAEIGQNLKNRLGFFFAEWFLDRRLGVPWFQAILGKNRSPAAVREIIADAALTTPGLEEILSLTVDVDTAQRSASVALRGRITSGEVVDFESDLVVF